MSKVWLIIKREYLTRVRNKTFLLSTFLLPIVFLGFIVGSSYLAGNSKSGKKRVVVINDKGVFKDNLKSDSTGVVFDFAASGVDTLNYAEKGYDGLLDVGVVTVTGKDSNYTLYSKKQIGLQGKAYIERQLSKATEINLLLQKNIRKNMLDSISDAATKTPGVNNILIKADGKRENVNEKLTSMVGFASGFLIYLTMFIFGAMVMRGVMEEKTNRIAEVIVSSIKPFELMLGKIVGIACVGLTQLLLWIVLVGGLMMAARLFISPDSMMQMQEASIQASGGGGMSSQVLGAVNSFTGGINWAVTLSSFVFYFLGGYLFYASLFAAIGSVVNEDPQEAQSLMMPITMPIIFAFVIMSANVGKPDSPAMFWGSMIPFTSPIVMMGRIPTGTVPLWQILLSMALLVGGFLFTTWLAGKIYRTGILMYGKKASWKEMFKWAFRKA